MYVIMGDFLLAGQANLSENNAISTTYEGLSLCENNLKLKMVDGVKISVDVVFH